jgi:hypothetical protein
LSAHNLVTLHPSGNAEQDTAAVFSFQKLSFLPENIDIKGILYLQIS